MDPDSLRLLKKMISDIICLAIVAIPILIFKLFGIPYKRGFYCDDTTIRYPYKDSTVTNVALYIVGLGFPIVSMALVEYVRFKTDRNRKPPLTFFGLSIPSWVFLSYQCIGIFGFGAACSQAITDIGKYSIGRLRPHFYQLCDPSVDCSLSANLFVYHTNFVCQNTNVSAKLLRESRLSFPSGHSSFSAYCMVFIILYLQTRFKWNGSFLLKHLLQFICLVMAWGTGLSRVSDYKHHWSDVLAGLLIGTTVALLTWPFINRVFRNHYKKSYIETNNGSTLHPVSGTGLA